VRHRDARGTIGENWTVCCIFTALVLLGPRVGGAIWWIAAPDRWDKAFSTFLWPLLGLLVLPWSTLMYVAVQPHGVDGFEWVWLGLALLADIASYSGGDQNRQRAPGDPY
jgi:hypothetical protein